MLGGLGAAASYSRRPGGKAVRCMEWAAAGGRCAVMRHLAPRYIHLIGGDAELTDCRLYRLGALASAPS